MLLKFFSHTTTCAYCILEHATQKGKTSESRKKKKKIPSDFDRISGAFNEEILLHFVPHFNCHSSHLPLSTLSFTFHMLTTMDDLHCCLNSKCFRESS